MHWLLTQVALVVVDGDGATKLYARLQGVILLERQREAAGVYALTALTVDNQLYERRTTEIKLTFYALKKAFINARTLQAGYVDALSFYACQFYL